MYLWALGTLSYSTGPRGLERAVFDSDKGKSRVELTHFETKKAKISFEACPSPHTHTLSKTVIYLIDSDFLAFLKLIWIARKFFPNL